MDMRRGLTYLGDPDVFGTGHCNVRVLLQRGEVGEVIPSLKGHASMLRGLHQVISKVCSSHGNDFLPLILKLQTPRGKNKCIWVYITFEYSFWVEF